MSGRSWFPTASFASAGLVFVPISFETNNTDHPDVDLFHGCGGETGADAAADGTVSNSGPSCIASILRSDVGKFTITAADGYRFVQCIVCGLEDGADAYMARVGAIGGEGGGHTTATTAVVQVRSAGSAQETTGRRIDVLMVMKNSGAGS